MPFADESIDIVIDFGTLYHIARSPAALDEIARVLVPGGAFVYETKASQFLSHPVRSRGRRLPAPAPRSAAPPLGDALGLPHQGRAMKQADDKLSKLKDYGGMLALGILGGAALCIVLMGIALLLLKLGIWHISDR
jgi:ubiquinone/menaquinone biosynthesis C-methylase UbiE